MKLDVGILKFVIGNYDDISCNGEYDDYIDAIKLYCPSEFGLDKEIDCTNIENIDGEEFICGTCWEKAIRDCDKDTIKFV